MTSEDSLCGILNISSAERVQAHYDMVFKLNIVQIIFFNVLGITPDWYIVSVTLIRCCI